MNRFIDKLFARRPLNEQLKDALASREYWTKRVDEILQKMMDEQVKQ